MEEWRTYTKAEGGGEGGVVDESQKAYRCAEGKTSPARLQRSFASFPMFYRDDLPRFLPKRSRVQRLAARSRGKSGETLE